MMADVVPQQDGEELFGDVCSWNFLEFEFGGRSYTDQIGDAVKKTGKHCAVDVFVRDNVVLCEHKFSFLGGSLGCAEGEKVTRAFEFATRHKMPIVVKCKTGGARMQEGTLSLMQMAKVSVAVQAHPAPFIAVLDDPTYGGVSASYAMQADIKIAAAGARIGFAGPGVILNTMFEMDQAAYDSSCPPDFQSAEFCQKNGAVDLVTDDIQGTLDKIIDILSSKTAKKKKLEVSPPAKESVEKSPPDYTMSRSMERPQFKDVLDALFTDFVELSGDGQVGSDGCVLGGLAKLDGLSTVVIGCRKGHTPAEMQQANYGMPSPAGYRTARRLMLLANKFSLPVVTFVDTCGAWPSFLAESAGQSEAIATNLTVMASLKVPLVTVVLGEGGSGGALGIAMGNSVGMMSQAYYGVISPEGAASILGRYDSEEHKLKQFPKDCAKLATSQSIYAHQLAQLGVVDVVLPEERSETFRNFPITKQRIRHYLTKTLSDLLQKSPEQLVQHRYAKYRDLGKFVEMSPTQRKEKFDALVAQGGSSAKKRVPKKDTTPSKLVQYLAHQVLHGERSRFVGKAPAKCPTQPPSVAEYDDELPAPPPLEENAKSVLDRDGPEALSRWVRAQSQVLVTDTTMRDAHQSLLATRVRTADLVGGARIASKLLGKAFSFECWGGATFDVAYRFLHEDPWDRLREIRAAAPNVCTQMLIRGANAVGYTSYPDNVVVEFVRLAAKNGMDVFRIFDCFNDVEQMRVCADAVRAQGKVAECCICYTSDICTSNVYNVDYYKSLAEKLLRTLGAHVIGIKDMAGLLKPAGVKLLVDAIRSVDDTIPIHFHTHATSSASLAVAMRMAECGCDIVDFATASMADLTSQPSLNAFCAAMDGIPRSPQIDYMSLEPYDLYWMRVRDMYSPFETGMLSGSARVFDHEIPGGQYANLFVQCQSMGLGDRWETVLDTYRDVNDLFGDIVKVTPSSKCVGDLALFLVNKNMRASELLTAAGENVDYPDSVVGLMQGKLGFPHQGFPKKVQETILKGAKPLAERPSASLPPADFAKIKAELGVDDERASSAVLYPKVFSDFRDFCSKNTDLCFALPTPVFFYSFELGQSISVEGKTITLKRVGPVKKDRLRTVIFEVDGEEQHVEVKNPAAEGEFDGPMSNPDDSTHVSCPMPGAVDKVFCNEGDQVTQGQDLFVISAMKMEVKVKAQRDGILTKIFVKETDKTVQGALLATLKP